MFAAVVTAAVLRHVIHVYGGLSREDIRFDALVGVVLVVLSLLSIAACDGGKQGLFVGVLGFFVVDSDEDAGYISSAEAG